MNIIGIIFRITVLTAAALLIFWGCSQEESYFISQAEFSELQEKQDDLLILDVREPRERTGRLGKIPGSVNIPLGELKSGIARLELPKDAPIVVLCRTQNRSQEAYRQLQEMGYEDLYVLQGGMQDYSQ